MNITLITNGLSGHYGKKKKVTSEEKKLIREQVLARDNHRCVDCGSTEKLSLHHRRPQRDGGPYRKNNLVTLCWGCHKKRHESDKF